MTVPTAKGPGAGTDPLTVQVLPFLVMAGSSLLMEKHNFYARNNCSLWNVCHVLGCVLNALDV